jgi:hypothetical protein
MALLKDILVYILQEYPYKSELSNARVTKIIYLADWRHVLENNTQVSTIKWFFNSYGPFVWDIMETAKNNTDIFDIDETENLQGQEKRLIVLRNENFQPQLTKTEKAAIDHIIKVTKPMSWENFIRLVYSTHPIISSERYTHLNLIDKAKEYQISW